MKQPLYFIFIILFGAGCFAPRTNRYRHGERTGRWIVYRDSAQTQVDNTGRYRKGIPVGKWQYFDAHGHLMRTEISRFGKIRTTCYYEDGKIYRQGQARIVTDHSMIHYFYYGRWKTYDESGKLVEMAEYSNGRRVAEHSYNVTPGFNDSLVSILLNMEKSVHAYGDSVVLAEKRSGKNSRDYQRYLMLNNENALSVFAQMDKIFAVYGYPGRALAGASNVIPFSIISAATNEIREKYFDLIVKAADAGDLEWTDVAFFVDKVMVAKKQKQVYGTQFRMTEDYHQKFYPVEDKQHLNERRMKVGLQAVADIDDTAAY